MVSAKKKKKRVIPASAKVVQREAFIAEVTKVRNELAARIANQVEQGGLFQVDFRSRSRSLRETLAAVTEAIIRSYFIKEVDLESSDWSLPTHIQAEGWIETIYNFYNLS